MNAELSVLVSSALPELVFWISTGQGAQPPCASTSSRLLGGGRNITTVKAGSNGSLQQLQNPSTEGKALFTASVLR